jgi:hypothetical protein
MCLSPSSPPARPRPAAFRRHRRRLLVRLDEIEDRPFDVDHGPVLLERVLADQAVDRAARKRRQCIADRAEVGDHHPPLADLDAAKRQAVDSHLPSDVRAAEAGGAAGTARGLAEAEMGGVVDIDHRQVGARVEHEHALLAVDRRRDEVMAGGPRLPERDGGEAEQAERMVHRSGLLRPIVHLRRLRGRRNHHVAPGEGEGRGGGKGDLHPRANAG